MGVYGGLEDVDSRLIRKLDAWWQEQTAGGRLPALQDLDLAGMADLQPNLLISEVETKPFRVRYRWVGRRVVEVTGFDLAEKYLDEIVTDDTAELWMAHYRWCYRHRRPIYGEVVVPTTGGGNFTYEFVIYPLRSDEDGDKVGRFLSIEDYFDLGAEISDIVPWKQR